MNEQAITIPPADLERCQKAGLTGKYGLKVLDYLDVETAIQVLNQWNGPLNPAPRQLLSLVHTHGWTAERLTALMSEGLSGCDIYQWRKSTIPIDDWPAWVTRGLGPDTARMYRKRGISAEEAQRWEISILDAAAIARALELGLYLTAAVSWVENGVHLDDVEPYYNGGWLLNRAKHRNRQRRLERAKARQAPASGLESMAAVYSSATSGADDGV